MISSAALEHYDRKVAGLRDAMRARGPEAMAALEDYLARSRRSILRELTVLLADAAPALPMEDADLWTVAQRTAANLAAMRLLASKAPTAMTAEDRLVLARYSGFGGLSIEKIKDQIPASLEVDTRELIHAYYTPTPLTQEIARATLPLLKGLVGVDGVVRAIEPSAGVGRFIRAFDSLPGRPVIRWTAVEYSSLAAALLAGVRPGLTLYVGPFERWIRDHGGEQAAGYNFVVSNPPFGERGPAQFEDPDRGYREKNAASYFVRRGLDLLVPGGLGIYIIPRGFLSDPRQQRLRELVLRRHHLACAFRLPTHVRHPDGRLRALFPGAHNVVDLLLFRRRHGELAEVDGADAAIVAGRYFDEVPRHVLGEIDGGDTRWMKIVGPPVRLADLIERPICQDCRIRPAAVVPAHAVQVATSDEDPRVTSARALARRVDVYLGAVAAGRGEDPALLWPELYAALTDWHEQFGNPYEPDNLLALAKDRSVSTGFLRAWGPDGRLVPGLLAPPVHVDPYRGAQGDPVALAEHLYRQERGLSVPRLMQALAEHGERLGREQVLELLHRAEWCVDGPGLALLVPAADYYTGDLWARYDQLQAHSNHPRASIQGSRLLATIGPALLGDLGEYSVREGWVPLDLRAEFMSEALGRDARPITLERARGLVAPRGVDYDVIEDREALLSAEMIAFLGWLNHDLPVFRPKRQKQQSLLEAREERQSEWNERFRRFIAESADRTERLLAAYNRKIRGFRVPRYSEEPLSIARWTADPKVQLHDYQRGGVRRIVDNRGGILSYDVGVGKTFTALAAIAVLRQLGVVRRPVVLVPNSLVFQWYAEIAKVLPDYRVAIIGAKFVVRTRGERQGETDSERDTSAERAAKWTRFQSGEYDLVLLTYSALGRTRIDLKEAAAFVGDAPGAGRTIALRRRNLAKKKREDRTERENAIMDEGTPAWIHELLELQDGHEYDGQVVWDDLGIDFLVIDEMHNFKNLFMPEARERGVPAFMGSGGEGSARAWQLYFRCASIRTRTGGAGILGLTATIAKNGPTELYTAFSYINPASWTDLGLTDAEQFIDQFCLLEPKPVVTTAMKLEIRDAMVGFKNITDLRAILTRFVEFRGASELARLGKIKKPTASTELVRVRMNDAQRDRMNAIAEATRARIKASLGERGDAEDKDEEGAVSGPNLGTIVKLGLIAIHPQLVDGYLPQTALTGGELANGTFLPRPDYHSPKFDAVAEHVVAKGTCGHIVFIEPIVAQIWMREVLVAYGVPRERVALLNAHVAPSAQQRLDIARDFNNGKYLVVIANAVAGEGANLQRRTCAVHNVDIPWDPMTRRQRNGRADRQGNQEDAIIIYDYLTQNSGDGPRFDKMAGKGTWIEQILESEDDVAINPAANVTVSPIELLADLTDDPEEARRLYARIQAQAEEEKRKKLVARIVRLLRATSERFRMAERASDPIEAARLRGLGQEMLRSLRDFDRAVWPFADAAQRIADEPVAIHEAALPLWNGARVWGQTSEGVLRFEVGRIGADGQVVATRVPGKARWQESQVKALARMEVEAGAYTGPWPDEEAQLRVAFARELGLLRSRAHWRQLAWTWASEAWLARWWREVEPTLRERLALLGKQWDGGLLPAITISGDLYLAPAHGLAGVTIMPPSADAWARFVQLAQVTDHARSDLRAVADVWWERALPASRKVEQAAPAESKEEASEEALVLRAAQARGLDADAQEQRLRYVQRARKYMEAAAVLLRRRGVSAEFGPRLTDGLTLRQGEASHVKRPLHAFGGAEGALLQPLAQLSAKATADVVAAVAVEIDVHGDAAIDVVLANLRRDVDHYDAHFTPDPTPAAPTPPSPAPAPPAAPTPPSPAPAPSADPTPPPAAPVVSAAPAARAPAPTGGLVTIVPTMHTKHRHPIWVATLSRKVPDREFAALRDAAREHGGHYSTFQTRTVPRGFVFDNAAAARKFAARVDHVPHGAVASAPVEDVPPPAAATESSPPPMPQAEAPAGKDGRFWRVGDLWFGDTALINRLGSAEHVGFGDFDVHLADGKLAFIRVDDRPRLPGQSGRAHRLHLNGNRDLADVLADLAAAGRADHGGTWKTWEAVPPTPSSNP